jgi:hypothetical protein
MIRYVLTVLAGAAALAAGCKSEHPTEQQPQTPRAAVIQAVEPREGAQDVSLTPTFKWRLPSTLGVPRLVSFTLTEFGQTADPPGPGDAGKEAAFASGLHDVSPASLDPFNPPPGVVLTGDLRDSGQLKPNTWYRWAVRAIGADFSARADFLFKTRSQ